MYDNRGIALQSLSNEFNRFRAGGLLGLLSDLLPFFSLVAADSWHLKELKLKLEA
jgi:hypothetical protein